MKFSRLTEIASSVSAPYAAALKMVPRSACLGDNNSDRTPNSTASVTSALEVGSAKAAVAEHTEYWYQREGRHRGDGCELSLR